ncbi:DUF4280 domain-containing protein [Flavivirga aquimarina]|uniref:DUF4280 domain-containing protein n=1 Tax=Flavivirga aquimarina TaxID=2027862 RepID=A0ABT8W7A0_9FLAO|nr:DUF4280 domain-containing protein [Flavivirga aquimarina]MDO5968970.1 DUF4280 domain-containing protein [Flavivirga aquimarina]
MGKQVCSGAMLSCTMGDTPSTLTILPTNKVNTSNMPAATIMDYVPLENILTFGMCSSPTNPVVATATTAALGVLTPMPCVPATTTPWSPGISDVSINNITTLDDSSTCDCMWAGEISIESPGQEQTNVS